MRKLLKVLKRIVIISILSLILIKPLSLCSMAIIDNIGNITGYNVVTYIDLLNEIYYLF